MTQYIDKSALVAKIERRIKTNKECMLGLKNLDYYQGKVDALNDTISSLDTLEVKEVNEELAETYMQVFEKKFPILPTLKGKQLDKFKNFLNRCQQIFGLQEFSIRPVQTKLFEKLALLWAVWGAENLQGIGQVEGESDEGKEVDLEKLGEIARHLIAVKEHIEDMRLDKEEWLMLEKIGYPERFKAQKEG